MNIKNERNMWFQEKVIKYNMRDFNPKNDQNDRMKKWMNEKLKTSVLSNADDLRAPLYSGSTK